MATNITYKGSELASFSNNTKTLKTAGKYLEGDITISASTVLGTTTVVPSEATQTISPVSGQEGLSSVTVTGITSTYIGSGVNTTPNFGFNSSYNQNTNRIQSTVTVSGPVYIDTYKTDTRNGNPDTILPTQSATTIIPSESSQTAVDQYKWTTGTVTVAAITPTYVGSGVTTRNSLHVSGPTVTASAGYYAGDVTATIAAGAITSTIYYGTITPRLYFREDSGLVQIQSGSGGDDNVTIVETPGYISTDNTVNLRYTIGSTTYQLPTLPAQSFTPSSATQTVASTGKYMLGDITVQPIPSEYVVPTGVTTITSNGTHNVTSFASASVNVQPTLQAKTFTPSETSTTITSDAGKDGLSSVTVAGITNTYVGSSIPRRTNQDLSFSGGSFTGPSGYYSSDLSKNIPVGTLVSPTISSSGLVTAKASLDSAGAWLPSTESPKTLQLPTQGATTVIPSETAQTLSVNQKYMTGNVTVAAITPTYVGSGITRNPTVTVSGPSVTIPAGYYSSQQTKTVASGSVDLGIEATVEALPTITVNASGLITAINNTTGQVEIVVDPGYVSGNTTGTIGIAGESTRQLSTQGATTVTPSSTTQTINVTGKYMTGNVTVNPIPSQYIVPSGTYTISSVDSTNTFNVTNYASAKVTITDADSIAY